MKFRKKPVVVEAFLFSGDNHNEVMLWAKKVTGHAGLVPYENTLIIPTMEGDMTAAPGDWIICGVKGEFYPCKPDIFEKTYERVK